jgi:outer membrane immunogenic protein
MKRILLASVVFVTVAGAPAFAADIRVPVYRSPPPPVYIFNWTGCYVGGNVGYLWAEKDITFLNSFGPGNPFLGQSFSVNASSMAGGLQAGCNYQFAGGWVVGIQGDYDWANAHFDGTGAFFGNFTNSFSVKSVASLTGRIGYAWGRFLPYVKGGGAWERDELAFNFFPSGVITTVNTTRSGWTIGIGGEYAFSDWITGFIEYDHYNFDRGSDDFVCGPVACFGRTFGFPLDVRETKDVFKVGLNLLLGPAVGAFGVRY